MHKKLREMGNSWGFVIPKALLELIKVNPVLDEIEIKVVDNSLVISKYKENKE